MAAYARGAKSASAKKGWETRRKRLAAEKRAADKAFRKRQAAAKKGWETRRKGQARARPRKKVPTKKELLKANKALQEKIRAMQKLPTKGKRTAKKKLLVQEKERLTVEAALRKKGIENTRHLSASEIEKVRQDALATLRGSFKDILEKAKEGDLLPKPGERYGVIYPMDSDRNEGVREQVKLQIYVDATTVSDVVDRIDQAAVHLESSNTFDFWLCSLSIVTYGRKLPGYDIKLMAGVRDPVMSGIQTRGVLSSGLRISRHQMLEAIKKELESDEVLDERSIVLALFATVFYYSRKRD